MTVAYQVPLRSTPLSEFKCPRLALAGPEVKHDVTKDEPESPESDHYSCICGTKFRWVDQTHYEIINEDNKAD